MSQWPRRSPVFLSVLAILAAMINGCTAARSPTQAATRPSDEPRTVVREFDATVFAVRPTERRRQSYQIALRPIGSDEAYIVECWDRNPFVAEEVAGDDYSGNLAVGHDRFRVRLEGFEYHGVFRWRLVSWRRLDNAG